MSLIEVRGLCKAFGENRVLDHVDLTVEQGERIAIIGASGCGKSLFLRSLELLEAPDAGQIVIDGQEITARGADVDSIRRSMGMVFQNFRLFEHLDVMENLCLAPTRLLGLPREEAEARAAELLGQVGLAAQAHRMPSALSGGQQQRVAICRCLMMEPKLLLMDEPTSALDPSMVGEVQAVIRMLAKREMSMLIVTHEMAFAREVASRVLFFAEGGIYEQGPPEQIFDAPQREKTIAFIRKIKNLSYEISERSFDLMTLQSEISRFGERYGLDRSRIYRLQICCEELINEMLAHCYAAPEPVSLHLDIEYAEADRTTEIGLRCGGKAFDPFTQADDGLGVTILKHVGRDLTHTYENGVNVVSVRV